MNKNYYTKQSSPITQDPAVQAFTFSAISTIIPLYDKKFLWELAN
jgi:hypothetical protein